jgi:hypothetical protein
MGTVVLELRKVNERFSVMICGNFKTLQQSVGNLKKCVIIFSTVKSKVHGLRFQAAVIDWRGLVLEDHCTTFVPKEY